jgi:hypothetical protein
MPYNSFQNITLISSKKSLRGSRGFKSFNDLKKVGRKSQRENEIETEINF